MTHTPSLGAVLLDQLAAAVRVVRDRFLRVPARKLNLGKS